jgi:hypothetical protein
MLFPLKIFSIFAVNWRVGRVVECGGLENHCAAMYRGFESLTLRTNLILMPLLGAFFLFDYKLSNVKFTFYF